VPDNIGPIAVPSPPQIDPFPLTIDYGSGIEEEPRTVAHLLGQPGLRVEQRFFIGPGIRRYRVRKYLLKCDETDRLREHFESARGTYAIFPFTYPAPTGVLNVLARYENPTLPFDYLAGQITQDPGLALLEDPQTTPAYTYTSEVDRIPPDGLQQGLAGEVQRIIPLLEIEPRRDPASLFRVSNQRLTVNGVLYQARLAEWSGISQTTGESADSSTFTFGNADRVFTQFVNAVDLHRATVRFRLLHTNSQTRINLWTGYVTSWERGSDGRFTITASDGVYQLSLAYPVRKVSRTCWKVYKGRYCPSTSPLPTCDKSYGNCVERGVEKSFGGLQINPQRVRVKDSSTGVKGWGRSQFTSVSIADDTVYQRIVQEIYTDTAMKVVCDVTTGRDEDQFYSAVGIVGEGPIGGYDWDLTNHTLDGSPPHDPQKGGGWRYTQGFDPALPQDYFGLSQEPWGSIPAGSTYAGGLAFAEIRRSDEKGLQLAQIRERQMNVTVTQGLGGWTWTDPTTRVWTAPLANWVWVLINVYLRAIGLKADPAHSALVTSADMTRFFDVASAIAMAAIADDWVPKLVGAGMERQFPFRGALKEQKPLKDWLQEIANCGLGYFTFVNGKLYIGGRYNSSVLAGNAYNGAQIVHNSFQLQPIDVRFNWLTGEFGDEEFDWQLNNSSVYDIDHASTAGGDLSPQFTQQSMNFVGVSNKSQAARIVGTRLREEVGGVGLAQQGKARRWGFRTTVLGLRTMVGDIISLDHEDAPDGRIEGRVLRWKLNSDYSIDIEVLSTTDQMYDLTVGPKPIDVPALPMPNERFPSPYGLVWMPNLIAPFTGDPLYPDPKERTFSLWQDYPITREGIWASALYVSGEVPVNVAGLTGLPRLSNVRLVAGAGTLSGPQTYYLAVTQRNGTASTMPSNIVAFFIPAGTTGAAIDVDARGALGESYPGWALYAGLDVRQMAEQSRTDTALPSTLRLSTVTQMTRSMPWASARRVRVKAKHVLHSGVAGVLVTGVIGTNKIVANDFVGSTENWIGRILSALADYSDGSAPLWNFQVTAFDNTNGAFTVTPDFAADPVDVGDVLIMRTIATSATATTVTDTLWQNSVAESQFGADGLTPDEEEGRIYRILRGKGAGQYRTIVSNTRNTVTVNTPWDVVPDSTSIGIIEAPDWVHTAETSDLETTVAGIQIPYLRCDVDNLRNLVALVGAFLVDDQERETTESMAVFREVFVYGAPLIVRYLSGAGPFDVYVTDTTLRCDPEGGTMVLLLLPLSAYAGREINIFMEGTEGLVTVQAAAGEHFYDGSTEITLDHVGELLRVRSA
jgi:hypothetical protein